MPKTQSRRRFLGSIASAGAAGLGSARLAGLGGGGKSLHAEPPPEVTTIRLPIDPTTCWAPQFMRELLAAEGFEKISYVESQERDARPGGFPDQIARGELDFGMDFAPDLIIGMDAGAAVKIVAGVHLGCFELLGNASIRSISELRHKTVGAGYGYSDIPLVTIMLSLLGIDPVKEIHWILPPSLSITSMQLFVEGKIDAFLAAPPQLQELRAKNVGHTLVSSIADRPWSQYYCCMLAGNAEFVRKYPVATKRVLRAILKAADLCASNPGHVAQTLVQDRFTDRYDYALQALSEIRYDVWRDYDPEDSLRFYALRLHEAGLIKSDPQKLIAEFTDWRFFNELRRELKA